MRSEELSIETKSMIIGYHDLKMSGRQIAKKMLLPPSTVNYIIKRFKEENSIENAPRTGRPPKISERGQRYLLREIKKNRRQTLMNLTESTGLEVSPSTLRREIHESEFSSRIAVPKPYISEKNAQKRLKWCKERVNWTNEELKRIIWSDECSIEMGQNSKVIRCWRKSEEKWNPECLRPTFRSGRQTAMVWGCFVRGRLGPLVILPKGQLNGGNYVNILESHFLDFWQEVSEELGYVLFQEDNAPIHTSRIAKTWRAAMGIDCLQWPAQSPDLNPIEQIWKMLKDAVQDRDPPIRHIQDLDQVLQEEWRSLDLRKVENLVDSLPERISEVIKQKGQNTRF